MAVDLAFPVVRESSSAAALRQRVRSFLQDELAQGRFNPRRGTWTHFDPAFSERCGAQGFIGVTWPRKWGGQEMSFLERHVILEEMLAYGAPVGAHWMAERQSALQLQRFGQAAVRDRLLPEIAAGRCYFGIGMSEPNSGSDLAAVQTRATPVPGGWKINGTKVWTTNAMRMHYLLVLARTGDAGASRHEGLTQFIVDLRKPGVTVRPIYDLAGEAEFAEEIFDDYFVPDEMRLGEVGQGWEVVTSELVFERSGPDRLLTSFQLLKSLGETLQQPDGTMPAHAEREMGRLFSHLVTLRHMSCGVSALLDQGRHAALQASMVKDLGSCFERAVPEIARTLVPVEPSQDASTEPFVEALTSAMLHAPSWTIRGGAREVLRGVIARELEMR